MVSVFFVNVQYFDRQKTGDLTLQRYQSEINMFQMNWPFYVQEQFDNWIDVIVLVLDLLVFLLFQSVH